MNWLKFSLYSVHEIKILVPTFFCGSEMAEKNAKILLLSLVSRPGSKEHWRPICSSGNLWRRAQPSTSINGGSIRLKPWSTTRFSTLLRFSGLIWASHYPWSHKIQVQQRCQKFETKNRCTWSPAISGGTDGLFVDERSQFHSSTGRSNLRKNVAAKSHKVVKFLLR